MEMGSSGPLVKVTAISEDCERVYVDFRNGNSGSFDNQDYGFAVGDVLVICVDEANKPVGFEKVPSNAWPDGLWVGIVKLKLADITIIEYAGRLRQVPTKPTPDYEVDNTVLAGDTEGVTRVLSEKPIKYIEYGELDDSVVKRFRFQSGGQSDLSFDDFGGLSDVVVRARELIEIPLIQSEALSEIGARPIKGVLFTGEPGTGKTMLARIIAAQSGAAFYEISGPEIFSKWYGQSEELLRKLFEAAAAEERAIIFFDEIDSVAAQRGDHSHEASKRVVAQLLTLMDGFDSDANVVVIAATNRPKDLDLALRRPGRFDWVIDFPYPNECDRKDILVKTARRIRTREPLPHGEVAAMTEGWSAAELAQIWSEASLLSVRDKRRCIYAEDYVGGFERVCRNRSRAAVQFAGRNT